MTGTTEQKMVACPALTTIKLISGKWKTRILWSLREGPQGFGTLRRTLSGVSPKVLTEHLRELEADGIIVRSEDQIGNVDTTSYFYSQYGLTLVPVLDAIGDWGLKHHSLFPVDLHRS